MSCEENALTYQIIIAEPKRFGKLVSTARELAPLNQIKIMQLTQTYLTIADGSDYWGDTSAFESESDAVEYKNAMIAALRKIAAEFGLTEETTGTGFADCEGAFALHTPDIDVSFSAFGGVDTYSDFEPVDATEINWFEKIYCAGVDPSDLDAIRAVFAAA